jgi:uncharacterized protein
MHADLEKLIQLQEVESQIKDYTDRIELLPKHLAELEQKLSATTKSLSSSQDRLSKLTLEKRKLESVVQDIEQKNSRYREQLLEVKTNEQYRALLHEIEFNREQIKKTEDDILTKMEEEERLRNEILHLEKQLRSEQESVNDEKKVAEAEVERDKGMLEDLRTRRQNLIRDVTPGLFETYTRIASFRKGIAVARARGDSCEACHVRIRPHVLSQIMSGEAILTCDSCDRILYWKSDAPYEVGT